MSESSRPQNRLAQETSPYLRQHANNPVDWYPWCPEALERARNENKPIFLSIGYSACHWCHVMEHESFEDEEIANILNGHFISIKVDREERPDLDQIYMTTVQMMTGHGGWPMTVFMTPELKPFFGGTYFPPTPRHNLPSFKIVLQEMIRNWNEERSTVDQVSNNVTEHLHKLSQRETSSAEVELTPDILQRAAVQLYQRFEPQYGGFGEAPKFPHTMDMRFLLRAHRRFEYPEGLHATRFTLEKMAMGGIYDHLGGGFARYSTDARWFAPHFEKMLYDNALLTIAYLEAFQETGEQNFRRVIEETLGWALREMTSPEGPFYSTLDADSEGEEGKFYVWAHEEVEQILGRETAAIFNVTYGVELNGNWTDPHDPHAQPKNILHLREPLSEVARARGMDEQELRETLAQAKEKLFVVRSQRVWPGRDEKILTAWNGLMISAFAEAAQILNNKEYVEAASKAADFLLTRMRADDGRLYRTWFTGSDPKLNAYLEDYAFLIDGLVSLYEATFDMRWIDSALELTDVMIDQFWDSEGAGFWFTGKDHEQLITRNKDPHDGAIPSGNSVAVTALLRLAKLTGRTDLQEKAEATLQSCGELLTTRAPAAGQMLNALDFHLGPTQEFAIVGDPEQEETQQVLSLIHSTFRPNKVVALKRPDEESTLALLKGKVEAEPGRVTTYVCENFTCQAPVVGVDALRAALQLPEPEAN